MTHISCIKLVPQVYVFYGWLQYLTIQTGRTLAIVGDGGRATIDRAGDVFIRTVTMMPDSDLALFDLALLNSYSDVRLR